MIAFDNTYAALPDRFFARVPPESVPAPELIVLNDALAERLGLNTNWLRAADGVAVLSGNAVAEGADPIAQAYAGHQFGGFVPQLGDGRAHLLGEVIAPDGTHWDVQLKGSGRTPFSRNGDGRAWLGPVLREYVVSEAMAALGVPTTRALAAVTTGQTVQREKAYPGAILTRVAQSHLRVGTFQYFAARQDKEALQILTDYALARHYPDAEGPLGLLNASVKAQAGLIARWMSLGFIHGVMNTDNSHIGGLTIDYGPCAFMDRYHPATVFSSIDRGGRYAWQNQPDIAVWNLAQLATALIPIMGDDHDKAVAEATEVIHGFADLFQAEYMRLFRAKLGLRRVEDADGALISGLLERMAAQDADFTNTFRALSDGKPRDQFSDPAIFDQWAAMWQDRRSRETASPEDQVALMRSTNPAVIPRNHRIEQLIAAAIEGDFEPFHQLVGILAAPFELSEADAAYARPPQPDEEVLQTFCGT